MFVEFGGYLISLSCVAAFRRELYNSIYYIKVVFNRKVENEWECSMSFETEEEMDEKWNELKMMLCPMKALTFDGSVKLENNSNPFFIHTDLANGNLV